MQNKALMRSHWICVTFLLPFLVMLWIHHALGLSDALLLVTNQKDQDSQLFNLFMAGVFYLGVALFFLHAFSLAAKGWRWVFAKLAFLAIYWTLVLAVL